MIMRQSHRLRGKGMRGGMVFLLSLILFVALSSCAHTIDVVRAEEVVGGEVKAKEKSIKSQVEALGSEDPRRQQIMTLTWQIQYQRERLKSLELKYLAACYKDKEYRNAMTAIESLNKQIRRLILL